MAKVLLFLLLRVILWNESEQSEIRKIAPRIDDDQITMHCKYGFTLDDLNAFETFEETKQVKSVVIDACLPPSNGSYAEVLKKLNVNVSDINKFVLHPPRTVSKSSAHDMIIIKDAKRPLANHFTGLDLKELNILNKNVPADFTINLEFLSALPNLKKLKLDKVYIVGPFPNTTKLERVEISGGYFDGEFGALPELKVAHFSEILFIKISLKHCKQLTELLLERLFVGYASDILLGLSETLRNVTVRDCDMWKFTHSYYMFHDPMIPPEPDPPMHNYNLTHLDVSYNKIWESNFLSSYRALQTVDISHNQIKYYDAFGHLPNLVELKMDHNDFEMFCNFILTLHDVPPDEVSQKLPLKKISIASSGIRELCFKSIQLPHLQLLNLTNNNISTLDYVDLYNVSASECVVDLRNNPLNYVVFTEEYYEALKRNNPINSNWRNLRILTNARFPCNCSTAYFARAVREGLLKIEGATCDDGTPLEQPRISYALQGCPTACEGDRGCSAANMLRKMNDVKDYVVSLFTEQSSLWWLYSRAIDYFW
ncbi:leucine rich repeat domain-containing protein [Phthorimaea operculella]|nr:leucine rich repeat domain-containing protein [Phthorimaea operculella]